MSAAFIVIDVLLNKLYTDVNTLLGQTTYKHGKRHFDVAEYYPDIGVCSPDSIHVFTPVAVNDNGKLSVTSYLLKWARLV